MKNKKALIMYVPNLHIGYSHLVNEVFPAKIYLLDESAIAWLIENNREDREHLARSFGHAWRADVIKSMMDSVWPSRSMEIKILHGDFIRDFIDEIKLESLDVVMPEEDISHYFKDDYLDPAGIKTEFSSSIFLRWNKHNAEKGLWPIPDMRFVFNKEDVSPALAKIIDLAYSESDKSDDWWRQVGAVIFDDETGEVILSGFNKHLPDGHHRYRHGDARSSFDRGYKPELVTAIHAEGMIFAEALRNGVCLEGLSLYVTTYPCPYCANIIALSGIKKVYFTEGYSVMEEGRKLFESCGIEVIYVEKNLLKKKKANP